MNLSSDCHDYMPPVREETQSLRREDLSKVGMSPSIVTCSCHVFHSGSLAFAASLYVHSGAILPYCAHQQC